MPERIKASVIEEVGKWIIVVVGTCYATGFLVVYAFMGRFHLRDHSSDLFRLKYIYAGMLCWLFPAGVWFQLWALFFLAKSLEQSRRPGVQLSVVEVLRSVDWGSPFRLMDPIGVTNEPDPGVAGPAKLDALHVLTVIVLPALIYMDVEFATSKIRFAAIPLCSLILFVIFTLLDVAHLGVDTKRFSRLVIFWLAVAIMVCFGSHLTFYVLYAIVRPHGWSYIILTLSSAIILVRSWVFARAHTKTSAGRFGWMVGLCLSVLLMFVAIFDYGEWIYPYVPVARGGGDYTALSSVTVQLKPGADEATAGAGRCTLMTNALSCTSDLEHMTFKVIDSTDDSLFLAPVTCDADAISWRTLAVGGSPPQVLEVSRHEIAAIRSLPAREVAPEPSETVWQSLKSIRLWSTWGDVRRAFANTPKFGTAKT